MSYETGGASSVNDLLDKLRIFALANGWTIDLNADRTDVQANTDTNIFAVSNVAAPTPGAAVPGRSLLLRKNGFYAALHTDTRTIDIYGSNVGPHILAQLYPGPYSSAQTSVAQTGYSPNAVTNKLVGPFQAYHFFGGNTYLHVVVEIRPAEFRHFGIGVLEKAGAVTNAGYVTGTMWQQSSNVINSLESSWHAIPWDDIGQYNGTGLGYNATHVRADSDAVSPRYAAMNGYAGLASNFGQNAGGGFIRRGGRNIGDAALAAGLAYVGPSTLTGRSILVPLVIGIDRPDDYQSLLGRAPDVRGVRIDNLNAGDQFTIGPDTWKVFPIVRKNGVSGQENSGNYGYAYKLVP